MTRVAARCRLRRISPIERCAAVLLLMATVCGGALALDRDRTVGQFYYTFWSEKDGAPSEISSLAQTQDGYLWIGSERGLFRFDGVKFDEYAPPPGVNLPSHSIYSLMATPDGGLWIAFEPNGLGFYKDGSLTVFNRPGQLLDSPVHCFARDSEGRIWAGTETGLAFRQGDRWVRVGQEWNFTPEMIRYIYVDREGTVWAATVKRIVYLKKGSKRFEVGGPVGDAVTTLAQAPDGRVWLADDGVDVARPVPTEGRDSMASGPSVAAQGLRELLFDRDGALWITRDDLGIMRVRDPGKLETRKYGPLDREIESFGPKDGFPAGFAYKLLEDREGNIWVGCSNGLVRIRHDHVVPVALPQGYDRLTLLTGTGGDLWVGTIADKPLLKIRGESMTPEAGGTIVSSVFRDANGDVWWGSRTGIWRQRGSAFTYFRLPKDTEPGRMWDLMPSSDGRGFWVKLGDDGLVRFDNGNWNLHDWPRGVPSVGGTFKYGPSASYRDASGRFWLGYTSGQIYLVDREHPTEYSQKDGLDLGRIKVIRGQTDHIWAGGELGLEFFSNGRFWKVQPASGEPFGAVSGIIETPDTGLWLNEMKGIVQIPAEEIRQVLADPSHRVACRRFDYLDGLPGTPQMSYTNSTAARTADGRLWFATDSGLAWIDPAHLARNPIPPPVSITYISTENGRRAVSAPIRFAAGTHRVEIDYAGLSLSIPERVQFRYRLEGVDKDWQDVGTRRQAYYNNMGPGAYRFRVIACNNDGVWNDTGAEINFSIAPAWFQTNFFRVLCVAAFATLLWMIYRLRVRSIHQRSEQLALINAKLEAQIAENASLYSELQRSETYLVQGQGISHTGTYGRNVASGETYWSEEFYKILELDRSVKPALELVFERMHPEDRVRVQQTVEVATNQRMDFDTEFRLLMPDGSVKYLHAVVKAVEHASGELEFVGAVQDITESTRAEEALRQAQDDLARINRVTTMGELTASLAHEISQPISGAMTNANVCLRRLGGDKPDLDEVRAAALRIVRDSQRAAEIVKRIRSQFEKGSVIEEALDVNEMIRETVALLRDEAMRHNISVRMELAADLPQIVGDRVQLQQVVMNLIVNSIEAMKDVDGLREMVIKSQRGESAKILVSVSDTGIGFPPHLAEQIFDPFFTTKPHGTGMGLRISRSIIEAHGGRLWAEGAARRGATFHLSLPAAIHGHR
jgi:signal transduction histidine kinase/ligand-binding sensor domain-containing protein